MVSRYDINDQLPNNAASQSAAYPFNVLDPTPVLRVICTWTVVVYLAELPNKSLLNLLRSMKYACFVALRIGSW